MYTIHGQQSEKISGNAYHSSRLSELASYTGSHFSALLLIGTFLCLFLFPGIHTLNAQQSTPKYQPAYLAGTEAADGNILLESTFDSDSEGWTVVGDGEQLTHESSGGRPGGYIHARDRAAGDIWFFRAPAGYSGNLSAAYGGVLNFDLKLFTPGSSVSSNEFVQLAGAGMELVFEFNVIPDTQWTAYRIPLNEQAGWVKSSSGQPPSSNEFRQVLSDLQRLEIRGEQVSGGDREGLDNVQLRSDRLVEIHVDPGRTYLHIGGTDQAKPANPVKLQTLNLMGTESVALSVTGDFRAGGSQKTNMIGVFSETSALDPASETHRVPGAIDAGEDFETSDTWSGGEETDIPEDFAISNTIVELPGNAGFLFVSPAANYFSDNTDGDNDYTLTVRPADNIRNYALDFDGSSNVRVPHSDDLNPKNITVEAWVKARNFPSYSSILSKTASSLWEDGYGLSNYNNGPDINFFINNWNSVFVRDSLPHNQWAHVAATYDGSVIRLYINGQLEDTTHYGEEIDHSQGALYIGMGQGGYNWDGLIDEVRIWDHSRSQSEINSAYKTTLSGNEAGLMAYYPLDGGSGSTVIDASGHGNTGSVNGANWIYSDAPLGGETFLVSDDGIYARDTISFSWTGTVGANTYRLDISTRPDASGIIDRIQVGNTNSYHYPAQGLAEGQQYYARVAASTDEGTTFNTFSNFTDGIIIDRTAPRPNIPNGRIEGERTIKFTFSASDNLEVDRFHIQIDDSPAFDDPIADQDWEPGETYEFQGTPGTSYYARAKAFDAVGNESDYSPVSAELQLTPLSDLTVTNIQVPQTAVAGNEIDVEWTVENTGDGATRSRGWKDAVYFVREHDDGSTERVLLGKSGNASFLQAGRQYRQQATFTIPLQREDVRTGETIVTEGSFQVIVRTDQGDKEGESTESNNETGATHQIDVSLPPLPDLIVTDINSPSPVYRDFAGATLGYSEGSGLQFIGNKQRMYSGVNLGYTYHWDVTNQGNAPIEGCWRSTIYFQQGDGPFDPELATQVASTISCGLEPGDTTEMVTGITTAPGDVNEGHFYVVTDIRSNVFEGVADTNNVAKDDIVTQLFPVPPSDLEPVNVSSPTGAESSDSVSVEWTVNNNGPSEVFDGIWKDRIYLSGDETLEPDEDMLLDRFFLESEDGNEVPADTQLTIHRKVRLPDGINGSYYLFAQVDATDRINELVPDQHDYEDNNVARSSQFDVALADYPDLEVSAISAPAEGNAGGTVFVEYEVENGGIQPVESNPEWKDHIYLSGNETTGDARRRLAIVPVQNAFSGRSSYSKVAKVSLPRDLTDGTYSLQVIADADDDVYEYGADEENNMGTTDIEVSPEPRPDLRIDSLTTDRQPVAGQSVQVSWVVENHGTSSTEATSWLEYVYISTDQTLNPDEDIRLDRSVHTGRLDAGDSYRVSKDIVFPGKEVGQRYLILQSAGGEETEVRDLNPGDNTESKLVTVAAGAQPDLRVDTVRVEGTPTAAQPLDLIVTVVNAGEGLSDRAVWWDRWVFSETPEISESAVGLYSESRSGPLAAGGSYTDTISVEIPHYASGNYYILTQIDSKGRLAENNRKANNHQATPISVTVPPPSDLVVRNIQIPQDAEPGEQVTIEYDLVNTGQNEATGSLDHAVYLSANQSLDTGDPRLALREGASVSLEPSQSKTVQMTTYMPDLANSHPGQSGPRQNENSIGYSTQEAEESITGDVPGLLPGNYQAIVWADVRNNIRETDDTNNRTVSTEQVNVTIPQLSLDTPVKTTMAGSEQQRYYRVNVAADRDLRVTLESQTAGIREQDFEIFIAHERAPTPADFDAAFQAESGNQPRVLLPGTRSGTYYVMARNPYLSDSADVEIQAETFGFMLFDTHPGAGGNSGRVIATITGAQLDSTGTTFYLTDGNTRIDGEIVRAPSTMETEVRFDLREQPLGTYDLVAEQENGSETRLPDAFEVEAPVENRLRASISMGSNIEIPRHRPVSFPVTLENGNNIDADIVVLTVLVPGDHRFTLRSDDFTSALVLPENTGAVQDSMPAAGLASYVIPPGSNSSLPVGMITVIAKDVRVGEILTAEVRTPDVDRQVGSSMILGVHAQAYSYAEFAEVIRRKTRAVAKKIRGIVTADTIASYGDGISKEAYLEKLDEIIHMSDTELVNIYRNAGVIGDGPITGVTGKPVYDPKAAGGNPAVQSSSPLVVSADAGDGGSGPAVMNSTAYPYTTAEQDGTCSNLATAASVGIGVGTAVYAGGQLAAFAVGALAVSNPLGLAITATSAVIFTAITVDSALNNRDWGLTGDIGGLPPTEPSDVLTHPAVMEFACSLIAGAFDPNDIVGPAGAGAARWVRHDKTLSYRIRFENDPERANAPAKTVVVTQPLDPALDGRSFRIRRFGFGGRTVEVTGSGGRVQHRVDARDSLGLYVDFNAGLDTRTGEVFFSFRSIDPGTGNPPTDPTVGFLPPNDSAGVGEGFVEYSVEPFDTVSTGTEIEAQADIVFDQNAAIETPEVFNTVDADTPASNIAEGDASFLESGGVELHWEGNDPMPGSGTETYTLYAAPEGGSFQPVATGLNDTTYIFQPDTSTAKTFRFFTTVTDAAGNSESPAALADATATVAIEESPDSRIPEQFALKPNYPNPFNSSTNIRYEMPEAGSVTLQVYDLLGRLVREIDRGRQSAGRHTLHLELSQLSSGVYFYRLRVQADGAIRFQDTQKLLLIK